MEIIESIVTSPIFFCASPFVLVFAYFWLLEKFDIKLF